MKHSLRFALLAATLLTASVAIAQDAKPVKDYTIVKFNGQEIKLSEVLNTWKTLFPGGVAPDFTNFDENIRQNVLRGLVSEKLIYQEAVKAGFDKSAEVKAKLKELEKQIIMQSYMESKAATLVTDAELKAAYDAKAKSPTGQEELKARHILLKTEEEAKKVAAELKKGGDFEKIAKERSTDTASGQMGGDLGWFSRDKMVPEFADAAFALKNGEVSAPVKSGFGWHIIKLEDRRALAPASFEDSKEALRAELSEKAVETYVTGLLKNADVKYLDADGKALPFDAAAKPTTGGEETDQH